MDSVQVDGGAYNVREGNHALNLAAIYGLRAHLGPFFTMTADNRDLTATAGMSFSKTHGPLPRDRSGTAFSTAWSIASSSSSMAGAYSTQAITL